MANKIPRLRKVRSFIANALVLVVLVAPIFVSGWWIVSALNKHDPRVVTPTPAFQTRVIDRTSVAVQPFKEPVISITFDDGWESVYTKAFPVLQRYGFHTTQYIITNQFDNPAYLSVPQLRAMLASGTQIASHTITHADLTTLDAKDLQHELKGSQDTLQNLFGGRIQDFTSPYGSYNEYTLKNIGTYYRSQKNAEGDIDESANPLNTINTVKRFDPMNISSYSVRRDTSLADLAHIINETIKNKGWLVLTYHQVEDSKHEEFAVSPDDFKKQLELISGARMRSATVGQVMDALEAAQKAKVVK